MDERLRVGLCDDHAVLRVGLRKILEAEEDMAVVGEAATVEEAVGVAASEHPDVFVVDLGLRGESGLVAIRGILERSPDTAVLVLTMHEDIGYLQEAFAAGTTGYLLKEAADIELVLAVRAVAAGRRYVHPTLGAALLDTTPASGPDPAGLLSPRERDILRLIALGHTNAEIAATLHLSTRTVETHRGHVQQKLGVYSRAELVRFARDCGLI